MRSRLWLEDEAKWSHTKAVETTAQIERLRDPKWRAREVAKLRHEAGGKRLMAEIEDDKADALENDWEAEVKRLESQREQWLGLATQATDRLVQTEQEELFADEVGAMSTKWNPEDA